MSANHRKYAQAIPLAYICITVAILACAATFGIKVLMLKQELKQDGEHLVKLRAEIEKLNTSNVALGTKKEQLISLPALKRAIADGVIKLKPIDESSVVYVPASRHAMAAAGPLADAEEGR